MQELRSLLKVIHKILQRKGKTFDDLEPVWRTIHGTHIKIEPSGEVEAGPPKFKGKNVESLPQGREGSSPTSSSSSSSKTVQRKNKGHLTKANLKKCNVNISCPLAGSFERVMGLTPQKFADALFNGLDNVSGDLTIGTMKIPGYKFSFKGTINGATVKLVREWREEDKVLIHDSFYLEEGGQNKGIGKKIFSNSLDIADHVGAKRINLFANCKVGSYAWAKFGFVPTPHDWSQVSSTLKKKLDSEYLGLDEKDKTNILQIISSPDPKNISILASYHNQNGEHIGKKIFMPNEESNWKGLAWNGNLNLENTERYSLAKEYSSNKVN